MSGEAYPGLLPDQANDRNLAPVQALHKVWDGAQGGGRNWQPVYLYREAITGNFAARVHDTDVSGVLEVIRDRQLPARDEVGGVDTPCPAGIATWLTPVFVCTPWTEVWFWVQNTGANSAAAIQQWFFRDEAATIGSLVTTTFLLAAGATYFSTRGGSANEWLYRPSILGAKACRLSIVGGANPTTAKGWIQAGRY